MPEENLKMGLVFPPMPQALCSHPMYVCTVKSRVSDPPPFDAQKSTPKRGGGLVREDLTLTSLINDKIKKLPQESRVRIRK